MGPLLESHTPIPLAVIGQRQTRISMAYVEPLLEIGIECFTCFEWQISQLMMRVMAAQQLSIPYEQVHLDRTARGKPFLSIGRDTAGYIFLFTSFCSPTTLNSRANYKACIVCIVLFSLHYFLPYWLYAYISTAYVDKSRGNAGARFTRRRHVKRVDVWGLRTKCQIFLFEKLYNFHVN